VYLLKHNTSTLYDNSFENETYNFKVYDCLYEVHADLAVLLNDEFEPTPYEINRISVSKEEVCMTLTFDNFKAEGH
jgi:hypothetical protein